MSNTLEFKPTFRLNFETHQPAAGSAGSPIRYPRLVGPHVWRNTTHLMVPPSSIYFHVEFQPIPTLSGWFVQVLLVPDRAPFRVLTTAPFPQAMVYLKHFYPEDADHAYQLLIGIATEASIRSVTPDPVQH